jgi:quinol monooxygenase YgiN
VIAVVWQVEIHEGKSGEFEQLYGANGEWTKLSRRSRSFLGSSFLRDLASETRYMLVEYWSEMVVYEKHRTSFVGDLKSLEERRDQFCESIAPLGIYSALDIPDRFGPTWSRRDGV